jgi:hypothetical protein
MGEGAEFLRSGGVECAECTEQSELSGTEVDALSGLECVELDEWSAWREKWSEKWSDGVVRDGGVGGEE